MTDQERRDLDQERTNLWRDVDEYLALSRRYHERAQAAFRSVMKDAFDRKLVCVYRNPNNQLVRGYVTFYNEYEPGRFLIRMKNLDGSAFDSWDLSYHDIYQVTEEVWQG